MNTRILSQAGWPGNLCALMLGGILPLAFAPFEFPIICIIVPALLIPLFQDLATQKQSRQAAIRAWWFGFGHFAISVSWVYVSIHEYGYTPAPIAALLAMLFAAGLALVFSLQFFIYAQFRLSRFYILSFPALWVLFEWFRSWFLTGFPWLFLGYAHIDSPLMGWGPLVGVYGLSFINLLLGGVLYSIFKQLFSKRAVNKQAFALTLFLLLSIITISYASYQKEWTQIDPNKSVDLYLVQGNIPQHDKWLPDNQRKILTIYYDLIQQSFDAIEKARIKSQQINQASLLSPPTAQTTHDVIIMLPEAAMPTLHSDLKAFMDEIDRQAKQNNSNIIVGILFDEGARGFDAEDIYNSITAIGLGNGLYHKQKLVPFGEYVPFEQTIRGLIPFFDIPMSSFTRGHSDQKKLSTERYQLAPFICYEILYPELVYKQGKTADFLVTISNDAWFGNSAGPEQHFQMARMRALELGKYLIRTTNTGTTALINNLGQVVSQLPKSERAILNATAFVTNGQTPYAHYGSRPVLLFCGALLLLCSLLAYRQNDP